MSNFRESAKWIAMAGMASIPLICALAVASWVILSVANGIGLGVQPQQPSVEMVALRTEVRLMREKANELELEVFALSIRVNGIGGFANSYSQVK